MRALAIVCLLAAAAHADDALKPQRWYDGPDGRNRLIHLSVTTVGLVLFPALISLEEGVPCRWCGGPNALDRAAHDALVWGNPSRAALASDITGYVLTPALSVTLVLAGTVRAPSTAALLDDLVPVAESTVVAVWATRGIKIAAARERPYAHFTDQHGADETMSFPSGHTSFAFALATSAGVVARARGYRSERLIWAGGITLAAMTGYLRIAGERHYVTDVVAGAAVGVTAGLTVPLLMRRTKVQVAATRTGIAFVGAW